MSQLRIWTSLAASVAIATLGSATPSYGQNPGSATPDSAAIANQRDASLPHDPTTAPDTVKRAALSLEFTRFDLDRPGRMIASAIESANTSGVTEAVETVADVAAESAEGAAAETEAAATETPRPTQGLVQLYAHQSTGNVILYVRDLPVMTFLGDAAAAADSASSSSQATLAADALKPSRAVAATTSEAATAAPEPPAFDRASIVARQIEALYGNGLDADKIGLEWSDKESNYWVTVDGDRLVAINDRTVLPEQTENLATDAWQVTNRLRRLLGGAAPLAANDLPGPTPIDFEPPSRNNDSTVDGYRVASSSTGHASWYGPGFSGRPTASGERFNPSDMTAAHRTLPFGTRVRVTFLPTGRSVIVRINDRGPFIRGRSIDLSAGAARKIGLHSAGVGQVRMEVLERASSVASN